MDEQQRIAAGLNIIVRLKEAGLPESVIRQLAIPTNDANRNSVLSRHWVVVGTQLRCAAREVGIPFD